MCTWDLSKIEGSQFWSLSWFHLYRIPGLNGILLHVNLSFHSWSRNITKDKFFAYVHPLCFINRLPAPVSGCSNLALHRHKNKSWSNVGVMGESINTAQSAQIAFHPHSILTEASDGDLFKSAHPLPERCLRALMTFDLLWLYWLIKTVLGELPVFHSLNFLHLVN